MNFSSPKIDNIIPFCDKSLKVLTFKQTNNTVFPSCGCVSWGACFAYPLINEIENCKQQLKLLLQI